MVIAALAAAGVLGGCATIGDDLNAIGNSLKSVSPPEAGRMMVDPYDPDNRRLGTVLISNSAFGGADAYLALYRDRARFETDPLVKAVSLTALGRFGTPDDAPLIAAALEDEQFQVRWEAAKSLQRIHNPAVVRELLRVLADPADQTDIRVAAAVALGQYPQDRVFQGLVAALDAPQLAVNIAAGDSLATLTGQDLGLDSTRWLRWYNSTNEPFAEQREFLFPTYSRDRSWLEKLAFWSTPVFEQPGAPAGLDSRSQRRTYQDDEPETHEAGG
jgi:hypothetical protein